VTKIVHSNFGK